VGEGANSGTIRNPHVHGSLALPKLALSRSYLKFHNSYLGLSFRLAGRIKGAERARLLKFSNGKLCRQTLNASLSFAKKPLYSK
jgi:hypothetical protein